MLPKLGLVSIGVHDDVLNWVAKHRPASIILVNERGQARPERPWETNEIDGMRWAMNASPKTLWIVRSWPDGIGELEHALWHRIWQAFDPFRDMPNPLMGHSYNEPGFPWIGSSGDARKLMELEKEFAQRMHEDELLSLNFCFSESHILKGNLGLWSIYADALPYVDALGFNEYDWPWVFTSRDQGYKWRVGHWEHQHLAIKRFLPYDKIPPVIIGEGILDGKIVTPDKPTGWQKRWPPQKYIEQHQAVHDDTYHKPGVFAHHTFCYAGRESEWHTGGYHVGPILPQLGQLIEGQVYWKEKPMPTPKGWENVPERICRWYPLLWKHAMRIWPYQMIPYKDIELHADRIGACIIERESEGNPNAVNSETGATGLMQIMPFHFEPGKDPTDPDWNIGKGCDILKDKLDKATDLRLALFWYSGKANRPWEPYIRDYWQPFVGYYKEFFGIDIEPPSSIQEALADIGKAKNALKTGYEVGIKHLGEAEEKLLGI